MGWVGLLRDAKIGTDFEGGLVGVPFLVVLVQHLPSSGEGYALAYDWA